MHLDSSSPTHKGRGNLSVYITNSFSYWSRDAGLGEGEALMARNLAAPMDQTNFGGQITPQAINAGVHSWKSAQ